jgi:hypothetical protein
VLNVLRREQRAAIDDSVRVEDTSAVLHMKEVVLREQFKKWKASYLFEGVDEAAWCTEFHTHFDSIPGYPDVEQLRALHVALREQLHAGELGVEAFDNVRLGVVSFQKILVLGSKQGGFRKDPFVYKYWMRTLRAQLQVLVSLYLRQHPAVIVATDVAVTTASAVATTPNLVAAIEGGADVASEDTSNDIDSDSESDFDSSSESDFDEDDTTDAGEGDSFKRLLRDHATELERVAFKFAPGLCS